MAAAGEKGEAEIPRVHGSSVGGGYQKPNNFNILFLRR